MINNNVTTFRHKWFMTRITNGSLSTKCWPNFQSIIAECEKHNPEYPFETEINYINLLCDLYFNDAKNREQRFGLVKEIIRTVKEIDSKHNGLISGAVFCVRWI